MAMPDPWDRTVRFFGEPDRPHASAGSDTADGTDVGVAVVADERLTGGRGSLARRAKFGGLAVLAGLLTAALVAPNTAGADPSGATWHRLRECESSNNYGTNTGNGHYGAYQFDVQTWQSVGGHGLPSNASHAEQDARALILYRERGWQPWQCAGILGLHEDKDARSGYIGDIHIRDGNHTSKHGSKHKSGKHKSGGKRSGGGSTSQAPAFPGGSHWYHYGETSTRIKVFQDKMHARGYFPVGTGQFGPNTLRMVKQLQRLNGLVPNGYLGPNTWRLAWTGSYHD